MTAESRLRGLGAEIAKGGFERWNGATARERSDRSPNPPPATLLERAEVYLGATCVVGVDLNAGTERPPGSEVTEVQIHLPLLF